MVAYSERIVGFVDTFSHDEKNSSFSLNGWVVDEISHDNELEFKLEIGGLDYPIHIYRHHRPDLAHYSAPNLGFSITCHGETKVDINSPNDVKIYARTLHIRSSWQELSVGHLAIEQILRHVWLKHISKMNHSQISSLILELTPKIGGLLSTDITNGTPVTPGNDIQMSACTEVYLPKGSRSFDGTCVLGGNGHAFLIHGSNDVLESYNAPLGSPSVTIRGNRWIDLFQKRQDECNRRSIHYIQTIIPEKISVMPELVEYDIDGPTNLLSFIENSMIDTCIDYVSSYDALVEGDKFRNFDKIDTHLSPFGAFIVFQKLIEKCGFVENINPTFQTGNSMMLGDIAERFILNSALMYPNTLLAELPTPLSDEKLELIEEYNPATNGHIGVRRVFRNPRAPIDQKLLVFGNSFFERGGHPKALSWWFARMFTEFHFVWQPGFVWDYVNHMNPDIIIGQTIERFLTKIPDA